MGNFPIYLSAVASTDRYVRSMPPEHCARCKRVILAGASLCRACEGREVDGATPERPSAPLSRFASAGALWLDDLGARAPNPDPPPVSPDLTRVAPMSPVAGPKPDSAGSARAEKKNARRAEVRRLRLQDRTSASRPVLKATKVLVIDEDATAREQLRSLLDGLGFAVAEARDLTHAHAAAAGTRFVAAFVDIALRTDEGGDGIDFCGFVGAAGWLGDHGASALVLVATQLRPRDRVRAELAGCADAIVKPVSRGAIARVLDGRGIPIPSDQRRA